MVVTGHCQSCQIFSGLTGMGRQLKNRQRRAKRTDKVIGIVVEGEETERQYFNAIKRRLKLSGVNIEVTHAGKTDPLGIVQGAIRKRRERVKQSKKDLTKVPYDEVWVVFDKDHHLPKQNVDQAFALADKEGIKVAYSVPCIEFWFLLHLRKTNKGFNSSTEAVRDLRTELPDYSKSSINVGTLLPLTVAAIGNAQWVRQNRPPGNSNGSYTEVDVLVGMLNDHAQDDNKIC